jgi:hypothetical protein
MIKSKAYAFSGGMFVLIGIMAITRHDIGPGMMCFVVAIGCALRANDEWKRENA